ncbi:MAG: response regulator [Lachnospiraceae bacterium]|nr:response regulator [Lachnospiraceae bacterium]
MYELMLEVHIVGIIICVYMLQLLLRRNKRQSNSFIVLAVVFDMLMLIGYVFELISTNVSEMLLAIQISYMGKCFAGASFVTGIGKYYNWKYKKFTLPALWGIGFLSFGIIMTAKYHDFYYTFVGMIWKDGHAFCSLGKAPYYYFFLGYLVFTFVYFAIRCLRHRKNVNTPDERSAMSLVGYSSLVAVITLVVVVYVFTSTNYDFGPLIFAVYTLVFLYCILRYRLFDTVDVAIYQMAAESAQALIVVQEDGYVIYANRLAERIMPWLVEWDKASIAERIRKEILTGISEYEIDGRVYQLTTREVSDNGSVVGYAVTLMDITKLRQYTLDLERLSYEANEANRAKSNFLANMSHEIRTPINTMLGMNEMISREAVSADVISYSQNIREAGKSLLAIINDILDFSKIESGKMEIIPVNYEITDIVYDLYNMIELKLKEKNLSFHMEIDTNIPSGLRGDDVRIRQIILNLLSNAVKYTECGGVTMRMSGKKEKDVFVLHVEVEDTGIGVREEDMDKIFSSFQRLEETKNRKIEGTGLGMSITTSFLFMMGSELCLESEYGKGSRFYFDLKQEITDETPIGPVDDILEKRKETHLLPGMSFEAPDAKILVVDDNLMNLEVFKGLLSHTQMQITSASDGREALDLFARQEFDMIFMDHMMPEMDGIETFEEMKRLWKKEPERIPSRSDIPVVILTANAIFGAREWYLEQGFADYLSKPIDYQKLEGIVTRNLPQGKVIYVEKQEMFAEDEEAAQTKKSVSIDDAKFRLLREYGIQVENGLKHMAGSVETYDEILKIYFEELPEKLERLRKNGTLGDMKAYSIDVHSLKSTSASIGAQQLADMAREHENQSRADNSLYVRQHMNRLCAECTKMIKLGEKFLEM